MNSADSRPRVLLFIDWFYPGFKAGGPVTSNLNMVEALRSEIDFFVVTRHTDYGDTTPYAEVPPDRWVSLKEGLSVYYFSERKLSPAVLWHLSKRAQCTIWYINGIYSPLFSILPLLFARLQRISRVVVAARGMLSEHAFTVKGNKKRFFLSLSRLLGLYKRLRFHATNADEAQAVTRVMGPKTSVFVAPNLATLSSAPFTPKVKSSETLRLISLARVSPEKNCLFALELLSKCNCGAIQLDWFGQLHDPAYVEACKRFAAELPEPIRVLFHGGVAPDQIPLLLQDADFFLLPTRGENFGHAIVEALLSGTPVIISDNTPWRDLTSKGIGWDISLQHPEQFVVAIEAAAAMDKGQYAQMSLKAREFALTQLKNPEVLEATRRLFQFS